MPYGNLLADVMQSSTTSPPTFQNSNGTSVGTLCRAWVTFNPSSGTPVLLASFNVSSITRTSTGQYNITFTNSMSDANYAVAATGNGSPAGYGMATSPVWNGANTASVVNVTTLSNSAFIDPQLVSVAIFR